MRLFISILALFIKKDYATQEKAVCPGLWNQEVSILLAFLKVLSPNTLGNDEILY